MTARTLAVLFLLLGAVALTGCATSYLSGAVTPTTTSPANVHLYVSNQSTEKMGVVLAVYVDDVLTLRRSMKSVFSEPNVAHGFPDEIPLHLLPGPHTIRVVAEGTSASAEAQVVVGDTPVHVSTAFDYSSRGSACGPAGASVSIHISAERPGFC